MPAEDSPKKQDTPPRLKDLVGLQQKQGDAPASARVITSSRATAWSTTQKVTKSVQFVPPRASVPSSRYDVAKLEPEKIKISLKLPM